MKTKTIVKRVIDIALTVTLLLLMAFQVTEQLAPNSNIGEGLSVHYSGGATLSDDVAAFLQANGIK